MFWDDENDSNTNQKFKNFLFLKFWGTNKERDETFPIFGIILGIVAIFGLIFLAFHK